MEMLNVNRKVADTFYRYKMPKILAKIEGKGNGIKTVIVNMPDIAKSLGRPATYMTKYFGYELGAQTQIDTKIERYVINGSHSVEKLQNILDGFINKYVLCSECDNPETSLIVSAKRSTISRSCKACGFFGNVKIIHRLNAFILKNPPTAKRGMQKSAVTDGNKSKRLKRSEQRSASQTKSTKNGEARGSSSKRSDNSKLSMSSDDDEDWTVDVSEAAVKARMQDLTDKAKSMTLSEDNIKNAKQRMDLFYDFIKQRTTTGDFTNPKCISDIYHEAVRLEVKSKAPLIIFELLIRPAHIGADVRTHKTLLLRFTKGDTHAQAAALYALDNICIDQKHLIPKIPVILKLLYDEDIIEENSVKEWIRKKNKHVPDEISEELRSKAEPFLVWLDKAEEDESDVDDDDVEQATMLFDEKVHVPCNRITHVSDEDEFDIDAI